METANYSNGDTVKIGEMHYPLSNNGKMVDYGSQDNEVLTDFGGNEYISFRGRVRYIAAKEVREEAGSGVGA
jgi:hypothetical protein